MSAIVIGDDNGVGSDPPTHERRPGGGGVVRAVAMAVVRWDDISTVSPCRHADDSGAPTNVIAHDVAAAA
jgi:hypothetical protein